MLPHPRRPGEGGAGGYAPSPNAASASGGVDTPDPLLPPAGLRATWNAPPPRDSGIQVLCSGLTAKNTLPPAPPARPLPPAGAAKGGGRKGASGQPVCKPGRTPWDCRRPRGDGTCTLSGLPPSRDSPHHATAQPIG